MAKHEKNIAEFVARCLVYQHVKVKHQRPERLLSPWDILEWKWEDVTMDFIMDLSHTWRKHDTIWVVVDRLSRSTHFPLIRAKMPLESMAGLYVNEIVQLHGAPKAIISG